MTYPENIFIPHIHLENINFLWSYPPRIIVDFTITSTHPWISIDFLTLPLELISLTWGSRLFSGKANYTILSHYYLHLQQAFTYEYQNMNLCAIFMVLQLLKKMLKLLFSSLKKTLVETPNKSSVVYKIECPICMACCVGRTTV